MWDNIPPDPSGGYPTIHSSVWGIPWPDGADVYPNREVEASLNMAAATPGWRPGQPGPTTRLVPSAAANPQPGRAGSCCSTPVCQASPDWYRKTSSAATASQLTLRRGGVKFCKPVVGAAGGVDEEFESKGKGVEFGLDAEAFEFEGGNDGHEDMVALGFAGSGWVTWP